MKLTTTQVAEKLGIASKSVAGLVKRGALTDVAVIKEGAKRHYLRIESAQVSEYIKEFGRGHNRRKAHTNGNGNGVVSMPDISVVSGPGALTRIEAKLDAISTTLEALAKAWS